MEEKKIKGLARLRYNLFLLKPYWKYGKSYVIITFVVATVFQPLSTYLATLLPQKAIDAVMAGTERRGVLVIIGAYTLGIALVAAAGKIIEIGYSEIVRTKIHQKIQKDVNEKALFTDYKYYDNPDFFTKFIFAQDQYPQQALFAMREIPHILKGVVTVAAMGTLIASAGPVLLMVTLFFVVLNALVGLPTLKPHADFNMKIAEIYRPFGYVNRVLKQKENAAELRSSGAGLKFIQSVNAVTIRSRDAYMSLLKKTMPFDLLQGIAAPIQTACILAYVILFVIDGDTSKIGMYASLTVASAAMASNLNSIADTMTDMLRFNLFGERIAAFFEAKSEIEPPRPNMALPPDGIYDIELRDVSFGYENAAFAIENLNLRIRPGQRIAIVGENGAGKTTLTKLLLRLYDVTGGAILINGRNIKEYDVHALRLHIGVAFQDVRILAMSLRDNLTAYHDVPDDKLMEVIHKLGLDDVAKKAAENGDGKSALDKMVSREFVEDGIVLSGGEAQRLSLARLFTGEFGLLVLDEPTAALDPLAEYNLTRIITDASNTATTVMIAHRLSTVRDFDIIYHIDQGEIIESGTHDELMAARGKYYEMFRRQAENYQSGERELVEV